MAHQKGLLRLAIKGLLRCFTGCMTRFPNHLERVLPRKYRRTRGPRDQRTNGPEDQGQGTKGPVQRDPRTKRPGNEQRTKGVGGILFPTCQVRVVRFYRSCSSSSSSSFLPPSSLLPSSPIFFANLLRRSCLARPFVSLARLKLRGRSCHSNVAGLCFVSNPRVELAIPT